MELTSDFFQKTAFTPTQVEKYLENARKDLKIAEKSGVPEVVFHFCYNAAIKLGIALIAQKGYKVRSTPGHHVKILEFLGKTAGMEDEANYFDRVRRKRNIDLYEGGSGFTQKESDDLLAVTKSLFKKIHPNNIGGFSLVELMVSITITAILMLGMSVFFSSTMHNMFSAQEQLTSRQGQFVVNEIIRDKFANLEELQIFDPNFVILKNRMTKGQLPFTYIGKNGSKLAFKDFFVFNDVETEGENIYYGDSGAGAIKKDNSNIVTPPVNFAGFAKKADEDTFYVALPFENKVVKCTSADCSTDIITGLNSPMDVETDDTDLYISDSGNNRIIKATTGGVVTSLVENLNFPTGLAVDGNYLFVSDTLNNRVIKFKKVDGTDLSTIAGEGNDDACNGSALYCKLDLPTGLAVDGVNKALYIADTGNDSILKVSEPTVDLNNYPITFSVDSATKISKISFEFPSNATLAGITEVTTNTLHKGKLGITGATVDYAFSVPIVSGAATRHVCSGDPEVCVDYFEKFTVNSGDNIFVVFPSDSINLDENVYTATSTTDTEIFVNPNNLTTTYPAGTLAKIDNLFSAGNYQFNLNLSGSILPNTFNSIAIKVFDGNGSLIKTLRQILRKGDGVLGTDEDKIEVSFIGLKFPTGIGLAGAPPSLIVANSLNEKVQNLTTPTEIGSITPFSTSISNFDYTSDFEISGLSFSKLGNVLEAQITAIVDGQTDPVTTQTYTFDAKF